MRVAIDGATLGSGRGGDETYLVAILTGLAELVDDGASDVFPLLIRPGASVPPVVAGRSAFPIREVGGPRLVRYVATIPRALAREPGRVDLVHSFIHAPVFTGVPRALSVTDLSFLRHPELFPVAVRMRLNLLVPWQARHAHVVITLTEFCRRDITDALGIPAERVFVVPAAVLPPTRVVESRGHGEAESPYFLYLGNLHPRKNVPRLIEAFLSARRSAPALEGWRLVIAGAAWWGDDAVRALARGAPPGAINLVGRVSDEEREALLRGAAALAYPSLFEGFGLPPVEAMARGKPVLASNTAALPEVLGNAALLVDPLSTDAIAGGLVELASSPGLREELRRRGLERAARYTPRATGEAALDVFRRATGRT